MGLFSLISVASLEPNSQSKDVLQSCDPLTYFRCTEDPLECIPKESTCNGVSECKNAADESVGICGKWTLCSTNVCIFKPHSSIREFNPVKTTRRKFNVVSLYSPARMAQW